MSSEHLRYLTEMDSLSLNELMQQYGKDVWNFAFLISKNRDMADDITQVRTESGRNSEHTPIVRRNSEIQISTGTQKNVPYVDTRGINQ